MSSPLRACGDDACRLRRVVKSERKWWVVFAAYIFVAYSTLGIARPIWEQVEAFMGGQMHRVIYAAGLMVFYLALLYMIFLKREKDPHRYLLYLLFLWIFLVLNRITRDTLNKMHMVEYAVMGIILYNALKEHFDRFDKKLYIIGGAICFAAGLIEETIQHFLPARSFTWRDVFINSMSGINVLLSIRYIVLGRVRR